MLSYILINVYAHVTTSTIRKVKHPCQPKKLLFAPFQSGPFSLPSPRKPLTHFLFLKVRLAQSEEFSVSGIMKYVHFLGLTLLAQHNGLSQKLYL